MINVIRHRAVRLLGFDWNSNNYTNFRGRNDRICNFTDHQVPNQATALHSAKSENRPVEESPLEGKWLPLGRCVPLSG